MGIAIHEKVSALSDDFGSLRELARTLGVDVAQISRWKRGGGIDLVNAVRVDLLEFVMSQLLHLYDPETAREWLSGVNPLLGDRRPIDLIRAGRTSEVVAAIQAELADAYA